MSLNSPKRSHSLVHHQQKQQQQQQQQKTHQEEHHANRLQPCIQPPQRSSSVREHQSVRLTRSSSLSHLSRKVGSMWCDTASATYQWQHDRYQWDLNHYHKSPMVNWMNHSLLYLLFYLKIQNLYSRLLYHPLDPLAYINLEDPKRTNKMMKSQKHFWNGNTSLRLK